MKKNRHVRVNNTHNCQRQSGFTLIELVIVIVLLGLLAATALPRLLSATDNAEVAALEAVAGGISTAVSIAHGQWAADGNQSGAATTASDKVAINLDGKVFYMNEYGWPANVSASGDAAANSQTADECKQVFDNILQSSPTSTIESSERANVRYFVSVESNAGGSAGNIGDVCRYELILNDSSTINPTHYFDFDLVDGQVTVVYPELN